MFLLAVHQFYWICASLTGHRVFVLILPAVSGPLLDTEIRGIPTCLWYVTSPPSGLNQKHTQTKRLKCSGLIWTENQGSFFKIFLVTFSNVVDAHAMFSFIYLQQTKGFKVFYLPLSIKICICQRCGFADTPCLWTNTPWKYFGCGLNVCMSICVNVCLIDWLFIK